MARMPVPAQHIVKIIFQVVQIAVCSVNVYVIYISLRPVNKAAFCIRQTFFNHSARKPRPVGGYFAATHNIGMICKIYNKHTVAFTVKPYKTYVFVRISYRLDYIGISDTGIGAHRAVLHNKSADKRHIRSFADIPSHFCRLNVIKRHARRVSCLFF